MNEDKKLFWAYLLQVLKKQMRWFHFNLYLYTHLCDNEFKCTFAGQLYLQHLQFVQCTLNFNFFALFPYR